MNPVDQFLANEGHEKSAGFESFMKGTYGPLAAGLGTAIVAPIALAAAQDGYNQVKGMINKSRNFKAMLEYNPSIKKLPDQKVKALFGTLHNVAPDLARDPVVASSWVTRMYDKDEYVDPKTISDLAAAQSRMPRGTELPIQAMSSGIMSSVSDYGRDVGRRELDTSTLEKNRAQTEKARWDMTQPRKTP